jgi:hypothetical protein
MLLICGLLMDYLKNYFWSLKKINSKNNCWIQNKKTIISFFELFLILEHFKSFLKHI